jgi:probable addiction module antidote protein
MAALTLKTREFGPARYLQSEEEQAEYLKVTCEDGTPSEIAQALGLVARACGITDLSRKTGLTRQALYKALSGGGNPELGTIAKVAEALGYRLSIVKVAGEQKAA